MSIVVIILALLAYGFLYMPVYLPFLLSFLFSSPDWRESRILLRVASGLSLLILILRPRAPRPNFGDDVAGSFAGADYYSKHEFWPEMLWVWSSGLGCFVLALSVGCIWRAIRHRRGRVSVAIHEKG
jgi:hypothetical protein